MKAANLIFTPFPQDGIGGNRLLVSILLENEIYFMVPIEGSFSILYTVHPVIQTKIDFQKHLCLSAPKEILDSLGWEYSYWKPTGEV